jgi:hypothetical protein
MYAFSIAKLFFLYYRFRNTYERNESHSLENCHVKILVFESESEIWQNKFLGPNPKKKNSDSQHWNCNKHKRLRF